MLCNHAIHKLKCFFGYIMLYTTSSCPGCTRAFVGFAGLGVQCTLQNQFTSTGGGSDVSP